MEMFTQCITISGSIKEWEDAIMPTFIVKTTAFKGPGVACV